MTIANKETENWMLHVRMKDHARATAKRLACIDYFDTVPRMINQLDRNDFRTAIAMATVAS